MPELDLAQPVPLKIGAQGMESVMQNIRVIVTTLAYSVPLDRGFANGGEFMDTPLPHVTALKIAELTDAIEKHEPRVKVQRIELSPRPDEAQDGRLFPKITFSLKAGVTL